MTRRAVVDQAGWLRVTRAQRARIGPRAEIHEAPDGLAIVGDEAALRAQPVAAVVPPADPGETVSLAHGLGREIAGRRILDGLDLELRRGELCVVTGRSGSGKTTLLRLLAGLDRPDDGYVSLLGQPLADLDRSELAAMRRLHVGIVPQESGLVPVPRRARERRARPARARAPRRCGCA